MLRFGLLICVCLFFLGCALLFAFGSAGSPCFECKFLVQGFFSLAKNHQKVVKKVHRQSQISPVDSDMARCEACLLL